MTQNRKPVVISEKNNGLIEVDVPAIPGWDDFDKLVQFLINEYQAKIVSKTDGPDARSWMIEIEGCAIVLQHEDPYGNSIHSFTDISSETVRRIGEDLEKRLAGF